MFSLLFVVSLAMFAGCDITQPAIVDTATPVINEQTLSATIAPGASVELMVDVAAVNDGTLSFQWFRFESAIEFAQHLGEEIPGATDSTFTFQAPLVIIGYEKFHFYVIVTNTNDGATGRRVVTTRSLPIVVGVVVDPLNTAAFPSISTQPEDAGNVPFRARNMLTPLLSVVAESPDDGELSFQWFVSREFTNERGDEIPGATGASFRPSPALLRPDPDNPDPRGFYFFVRVTNTNFNVFGRRESFVLSQPASLNIIINPYAEAPVILSQPVGAFYFVGQGEDVTPIIVRAVSDDGGDLSFSWQMSSEATTGFSDVTVGDFDVVVQPVPVPGEPGVYEEVTVASFTPVIDTATAERHYFQVIITNRNELAVNRPEEQTTSNVAEIVVTDPANVTANLVIGIGDLTQNYNTIVDRTARIDARSASAKNQFVRGFGGMDVAWSNFPTLRYPQDFHTLFGTGRESLGLNMLRIMILPWNADIQDTIDDFHNSYDGVHFFDGARFVNNRGGYVLASPWTPPAVWKSNNSVIGTGTAHLRPIFYRNFAQYLRDFAMIMANQGAPIFTISIQNEPNYSAPYDGCNWTPDEMRDFFIRMGYFTRAGVSGVDGIDWPFDIPGFGGGRELPYVFTFSGSSANTPDIHNSLLNHNYDFTDSILPLTLRSEGGTAPVLGVNRPVPLINDRDRVNVPLRARDNVAFFGRHPYGHRMVNLGGQGTGRFSTVGGGVLNHNATYGDDPREVWQTEFNLNSVANFTLDSTWPFVWSFLNSVDITIRNNHENAYIWWAIKRFYSMIGEGQEATLRGQIMPRGWAMAHYARFANETYHVGVTASGNLFNQAGDSVPIAFGQTNAGNLNPINFTGLGAGMGQHVGVATEAAVAARVTAFLSLRDHVVGPDGRPGPDPFRVNLTDWVGTPDRVASDVEYMSFVMFTPTDIGRNGGFSMGWVQLNVPEGFVIRGAETMRTRDPSPTGIEVRDVFPEFGSDVQISLCRTRAYVYVPRNEMFSIRLFNQ